MGWGVGVGGWVWMCVGGGGEIDRIRGVTVLFRSGTCFRQRG